MSKFPEWLSGLIRLQEFGGDWSRYVNEVFSLFYRDFIQSKPVLRGRQVRCRRDPICDGKEAGFWHCVSEGSEEESRTPDLRRCERIGWIRTVIENADEPEVEVWTTRKRNDDRLYLWLREEYLVVLGLRRSYYQLITAFCTDYEHTRRKLRRERDRSRKS
ncbi:MAG TPA: hypothetical protein VMZ92_06560 [Planctomycetota bacterium]|nr:hypothetical protein [Planctomycetota bacterium]